jgi:hypothetical protein
MIKKLYFLIFFLLIWGVTSASAKFGPAEKSSLKETLAIRSILSDSEVFIAKDALKDLDENDSREELKEIVSLLEAKIGMDLGHLRLAMLGVERISYINYSGFSKIPNNYFRPMNVKYEEFDKSFLLLKDENWNKLVKYDQAKLIQIIRKLEGFLYGPGDKSIDALWGKLSGQVKDPYKAWNQEYHRLEKIRNKKKPDPYPTKNELEHNQADFMDAFNNLRNNLRLLSPYYSADF